LKGKDNDLYEAELAVLAVIKVEGLFFCVVSSSV